MNKLKVEYVSTSSIAPYEMNAKIHDADQIEQIKRSIQDFGFNDPIGVWHDTIVEGHGRLIAAQELGIETVPIIRLDELTDEQRKAYALVHNKLTMNTDFDADLLEMELEELTLEDIDMSVYGFELSDGGAEITEVSEDDYDGEVPEEPRSKVGDLYQLGKHRLICGNSTDVAVIDRLMDGVKANLSLTDPPYGIDIVSHNTRKIGGDSPITVGKVHGNAKNAIIQQCKEYAPVIGDDTTDTAKANYDVLKKYSENQIIFGGNYFTDFLPPSRCWVVWDKQNSGTFADAELAWTSFDKVVKLYHFMWNGLCREGSREVEGKTRVHPTQKPVGMLADILKDFSEENDSVLDCFGGSGSTLIACEQLNRKCYMCELDPKYVSVILQRYINFKGSNEDVFLLKDGKKIPYSEVE